MNPLVLVALLVMSTVSGGLPVSELAVGPPANGPAHGVNATTYAMLWSNDIDGPATTPDTDTELAFVQALARTIDFQFDAPPLAVDRWNAGEHREFRAGNRFRSVYPAGASVRSGVYIRDAHATVLAVSPSTLMHDATGETLLIRPAGDVFGVVDYRVQLPPNDNSGSTRRQYWLQRTSIETVTLTVDGRQLGILADTHTPRFSYAGLTDDIRLTLRATIRAEVARQARYCDQWNRTTDICDGNWTQSYRVIERTLTVSDTVTASVTDPTVRAHSLDFVDSDAAGVVVHTTDPWAAIKIGTTRIRSPWTFYTAGRPGWEMIYTASETGRTATHSPVRPLQTHAVAVRADPERHGSDSSTTLAYHWGSYRSGASLLGQIAISPIAAYRAATGVAVRTSSNLPTEITLHGLVGRDTVTTALGPPSRVYATSLTATLTPSHVPGRYLATVEVRDSTGQLVTKGNVSTGDATVGLRNGRATLPVTFDTAPVRISYEPAEWWDEKSRYERSTAYLTEPAVWPSPDWVISLAIVTALWFAPLALLFYGVNRTSNDRLFGGFR